jgi:hypothetical protein
MTTEIQAEWAIVELMGHKVVAGLVQKSEMLGKPMLRIDVPETEGYPAHTQFYGDAAIYSVTFVSEDVARLTANQLHNNPVAVYVPDLVTREKYNDMERQARDEIQRLSREVNRLTRALRLEEELKHELPERAENDEVKS